MIRLWVGAFALAALPAPVDTLKVVTEGTRCTVDAAGTRSCEYQVGKSLRFWILEVGKGATITIEKSDMDGDYYVTLGGGLHDCVIVKPGKTLPLTAKDGGLDLAFVSPRTGIAFRTWQLCAKG